MRSTSRKRENVKLQPPMTPMIDCIFQLLLFFMLMPSSAGREGYLTTNLPKDQGPNPIPKQEILERVKIELLDEGNEGQGVSIILNETQSLGDNFEGLRAALEGYRAQGLQPTHPILISPTMAVRHKFVVRAFDAAVTARFTSIHFAVPR
jgi:biopolymer transport protein ExbD